jgi:Pyruvate/2-oxoacid:ferredoxin oxidoreductase gamma subunit
MASLEKIIRERFPKEDVDVNLAAIRKTYEITKVARAKD